jgi:hypothetical protein
VHPQQLHAHKPHPGLVRQAHNRTPAVPGRPTRDHYSGEAFAGGELGGPRQLNQRRLLDVGLAAANGT